MREIKFRVWHKGQNKMLPVYALDWVSNSKDKRSQKGSVSQVLCERGVSVFDTTYSFPIWEVELMQFTGLKDKNGKEIYEEDILQYKRYYAAKRWWSHTEDIPIIEKEVQSQRENWYLENKVVSIEDGCTRAGYPITGEDIARGQRFKSGTSTGHNFEEKYWDFEVIGNIYENPELLK